MKYGGLILETKEYDKLIHFIGMGHHLKDDTYKSSIDKLWEELKSSKRVSADKMPNDVVRINSTVEISFPDGAMRTFQVVTPDKSDVASNKISLLAPMSLALFGYAAGDDVLWQFPSGIKTIKIITVKQMEPEKKKLQS